MRCSFRIMLCMCLHTPHIRIQTQVTVTKGSGELHREWTGALYNLYSTCALYNLHSMIESN